MTLSRVLSALAWVTVVAACGGGDDGPAGPENGGNNTPPPAGGISVTNNSFSPSSRTITTGATVTWAWSTCSGGDVYGPETCVAHSVNFDDGTISPLQEKGTYARTFTAPGTYPYHCSVHGAAMAGTIIAQ